MVLSGLGLQSSLEPVGYGGEQWTRGAQRPPEGLPVVRLYRKPGGSRVCRKGVAFDCKKAGHIDLQLTQCSETRSSPSLQPLSSSWA